MDTLDSEPSFTLARVWDNKHIPRLKQYTTKSTSGKYQEEEVIIDEGNCGLEYLVAMNIMSFLDMQKTIGYENGELFNQFPKSLAGTRYDLWKEVVDKNNTFDSHNVPDLQTTAHFHKALGEYMELIVNKTNLCNMQFRYMRIGGSCKKDPQLDCVEHLHRFNKVYNVSLALPHGILPSPSAEEKKTWFYIAFCMKYRLAFRAKSLDLKNLTIDEVTDFMQLQWKEDKVNFVFFTLFTLSPGKRRSSPEKNLHLKNLRICHPFHKFTRKKEVHHLKKSITRKD